MKKVVVVLMMTVAVVATGRALSAREAKKSPPAKQTRASGTPTAIAAPVATWDGENAIKALRETFVKAFNAGDADAAAATYTATAIVVDERGERLRDATRFGPCTPRRSPTIPGARSPSRSTRSVS